MTFRCLRSAAWAASLIVPILVCSCDVLNPQLVAQLGGNTGTSGPEPTGSIVLVFNNQRAQQLTLSYDAEVTRPGEIAQRTGGGSMSVVRGFFAISFDCNTTAIILTGITSPTSTDTGTTDGTTDATSSLDLAATEFRRPALQCGSVLFVNVPMIGSPTVDLLP